MGERLQQSSQVVLHQMAPLPGLGARRDSARAPLDLQAVSLAFASCYIFFDQVFAPSVRWSFMLSNNVMWGIEVFLLCGAFGSMLDLGCELAGYDPWLFLMAFGRDIWDWRRKYPVEVLYVIIALISAALALAIHKATLVLLPVYALVGLARLSVSLVLEYLL